MSGLSALSNHRTELLTMKADLIRDIGAANASALDKDISECDRLIELAIISAPNAEKWARLPLSVSKISEGYRIVDCEDNHVLDIHDEPVRETGQHYHTFATKQDSDGNVVQVCTGCGIACGVVG